MNNQRFEKRHQMTQIGALLNIDPGQSEAQIEKSFLTMKGCGMTICRIVLDPVYGSSAQEQYDAAFRIAAKTGISIVASLRGDEEFCVGMVDRYKGHQVLSAWELDRQQCEDPDALVRAVKETDGDHEVITEGLTILPGIDFNGISARRFEIAVSAVCDMARSASGSEPLWVTGLQGGSNLYSGSHSFSPTAAEVTQWLWTAVAAGAKGIFMQSVNSKKDGKGAGEMSLLNMQGGATERSEAVRKVVETLAQNAELFEKAVPVHAPVTMIYTKESILAEAMMHRDDLADEDYEVRQKGGSMKDALAIYQVIMERGIRADFREISEYPWDEDSKGRCVVFAGQLSVPVKYYPKLREFVKKGGKVIIEGLSFCYDENMNSVFSSDFPLKDVFGGYVEEYNCRPGRFKLRIGKKRYWVHLFEGVLHNEASGESLRILRNKYGRGSVLWIPSVIGMGALKSGHKSKISRLFKRELEPVVKELPMSFRRRYTGIALQMLETPDHYITIVTSNKKHRRRVVFKTEMRVSRRIFFNDVNYKIGKARNHKVKVHPGQTVVALWDKVKKER